ncbi:YSIRK-targeted surface antigen transcriptional regulator [Streptococcus halichoeri]|uniref:YSIRK-targeted surface antigen transcriptional regulator n=1 Tax=Streptococcus halichoeri TaxID=254785 RepID=UPI0013599116|nr:YSIRK-targeted surface antigen transcriptional regulator [Streptococcus halichoeri]
MYRHPLLESLQTCLQVPILVLDESFKPLKAYPFNISYCLSSQLKQELDQSSCQRYISPPPEFKLLVLGGDCILAVYPLQSYFFIFGPFTTPCPLDDLRPLARVYYLTQERLILPDSLCLTYVQDLSHLLHLIHYFFTGHAYGLAGKQAVLETDMVSEMRKELSERLFSPYHEEEEQFDYECQLLECVKKGDPKEVQAFLRQALPWPQQVKNARAEKNYSILIFEKLSQLAISMGVASHYAHHIRDYYIKKCEQCATVQDVLALRESAILLFTQKIGRMNTHSYTMARILAYIHKNLSQKLLIETIAKQFNFSEPSIRKLFRKEMSCSIQQYIRQKKIEEAKIMLKNGATVTEVSNNLGYADAAHFSRTFKEVVGLSPKQFQQSPIKDIT